MGKKLIYYAFRAFIGLFRIIPFWALYLISDFFYFIFAYLIKYRKSVINKNLHKCFPEKTETEIQMITKKFYKNLCDLFLESFKGFSMSREELIKRFKVYNSQVADRYFDQGKNVIVMAGHFANWEWGSAATAASFKHQPAVLYKPISNLLIDTYIKEKRARFGVEMVSINQTTRYFLKKKVKPVAYYMVADQFAPNTEKQKLVNFFGSKTGFLHGPENYSKQFDIPVVYIEMRRVKRGYYSMEMIDICEHPKELQENELTQIYATLMEKSILKQPEDWMWSHKRWKRELYSFD